MGMRTLYLASALIATAIPLSAGAAPAPADQQSAAATGQYAPTSAVCPATWVWEPAGYMGNGHWRPAHCAPRDAVIP